MMNVDENPADRTNRDFSLSSEIRKLPWRVGNKLNKLYYRRRGNHYNVQGTSIFDRDWDNLIILDAARRDEFESICEIEGDSGTHTSLGAGSHEFVKANFAGKDLRDTVVVTANAFYQKVKTEQGYKIHDLHVVEEYDSNEVQRKFIESGRGGWNMPEPVTRKAKEFADKYPQKRLLVHYHQPHSPYIGRTGLEYFNELPHKLAYRDKSEIQVSDEILRKAYRENLEIAIQAVEGLLTSLDGRTVISADHGEMLGERGPIAPIKYYGHITGLYTEELTEVPWFIVESADRKEIKAGGELVNSAIESDAVDDRLRDLGYKV